jgi:hypothetical protein
MPSKPPAARSRRACHFAASLICLALMAAVTSPAMASAVLTDYTWSGQTSGMTVGASNWSNTGNWVGGVVPSTNVGTLTFPALTTGNCANGAGTPGTCMQSHNDLSNLSVSGLAIDDAYNYNISGNSLTVGGGGIAVGPGVSETSFGNPQISTPLVLGANQSWTVAAAPSSGQQVAFAGDISGTTGNETLGISFSGQPFLGIYGNAEVGAVTVTNATGSDHGQVVLGYPGHPGSLNGTNGHSVSFTNGAGLFGIGSTGALSMSGSGSLQIGQPGQVGELSVNGAVSLNSSNTLSLYVKQAGQTAGTDYSDITSNGAVNLGGASLSLGGYTTTGSSTCLSLNQGDVLTLVHGASITGTLKNLFGGATINDGDTIDVSCQGHAGTPPTVTINYTSTDVTATVVNAGSGSAGSTTSLQVAPSNPVTNQQVTLTATVGGSGTPSGAVEFDNGGVPISGCAAKPVSFTNGGYHATCQTSFDGGSSPESLSATFNPDGSSTLGTSTSSTVPLNVGKSSTSTGLSVSNSSPQTGDEVTYTATVTPGHSGTFKPTGVVEFFDNGNLIATCSGQPLSTSSPFRATCAIGYGDAGSHSITATYDGDDNFSSSSSGAQGVTVTAPPTDTTTTTTPTGTNTTPTGTSTTPTDTTGGGTPSGPIDPLGGLAPNSVFLAPVQFSVAMDTVFGTAAIDKAGSKFQALVLFKGVVKGLKAARVKTTLIGKYVKSSAPRGILPFTIKLNKKAVKAFKKKKTLKVTLKTIITPPGGKAIVKTKTVTLKRGKPAGCARVSVVAHTAC